MKVMTHAKEWRIRAVRMAEVMAEDTAEGGPAAEDTGGVAEAWEAAKAMKNGRKCMNSSVRPQQ